MEELHRKMDTLLQGQTRLEAKFDAQGDRVSEALEKLAQAVDRLVDKLVHIIGRSLIGLGVLLLVGIVLIARAEFSGKGFGSEVSIHGGK